MQRDATLPNARPDAASPKHDKEPLQIRIPGSVKRRFKAHAALRGLEPNELFVELWHHYENTHPAAGSSQDI